MMNLEFKAIICETNARSWSAKHQLVRVFLNSKKYKFSKTSLFILDSEIDLATELMRLAEKEFLDNLDIVNARKNIIEQSRLLMAEHVDNLKSNKKLDVSLLVIYLAVKQKYIRALLERLNVSIQGDRELSYPEMCNFLCSALNHIALILSEIDYIVFWKSVDSFDPFVTIDYLDLIFTRDIDRNFITERLKLYKDNGLLRDKYLCVKLYVSCDRLNYDTTLSDTYQMALEDIKNCGFEVISIL